jgi:hypothetical protein
MSFGTSDQLLQRVTFYTTSFWLQKIVWVYSILQAAIEAQRRSSFPLLAFRREDARLLRRRRCIACTLVSERMTEAEQGKEDSIKARIDRLQASLQTARE